jgi:murein DD-endopeptidase MepM/ murein hydrolase activator NlpD
VVQAGESLRDIARRAGVPVEDLMEINGLGRADEVKAGQLVFVLDAGAPARASETSPGASPAGPATAPGQAVLSWPLAEPRLTSPFGLREGRVHEGIDLGAPIGTPIHAAQGGQVLYAGDAVRGYGNMVVLLHAGDLLTVYAHNSVLLVKKGQAVQAGQEIARVGQSGRATVPHLHFEVRRGHLPADPLRFLPHLGTVAVDRQRAR